MIVGMWRIFESEFLGTGIYAKRDVLRRDSVAMAPELRFRSHNMIATVIYCPVLIVFVGFDDSLFVFTSFTINIAR